MYMYMIVYCHTDPLFVSPSLYCPPFSYFVIQENLNEESRLKVVARNKLKQTEEELEHLNQQVEDEEEAKNAFKNKLTQMTQQVLYMQNVCTMYIEYLKLIHMYMYSSIIHVWYLTSYD